jgi:AcrR family transcriptional regulator
MKTRDRILEKAQELFNKNGIGKVSVRSICEELEENDHSQRAGAA